LTRGPRDLRAVVAVMTAVATAATLAACGSGGDDSVGPGAIAEAATTTGSVRGAAVSLSATMTAEALGDRELTFTGGGYQDVRRRSASITMDMSKMAEASGQTGIDPDKLKMRMIYVPGRMYMQSPLTQGKLPGGKDWVKIDMRRALEAKGIDASALTQGNPMDYLRYLRATSGRVERVGGEDVRGVATTHYKATVDLRRTPKLDRRSAERLIQLGGTATMPTEVWIDQHHLVRRMRLQISMKMPPNAGAAAGQQMHLDETVELYNFGPKPRVVPPPADQVYDATGLAERGTGGSP
jgi:hypothetical protein